MELYTLSPTTNLRENLIETFDSFIWTERYSSLGDVQLVVEPSIKNITTLIPGTILGTNVSDIIMIIDSVERSEDSDGKNVLKINGSSFESVLDNRLAKKQYSGYSTNVVWKITGTPGNIIKTMFDWVCINPAGLDVKDNIPNMTSENLSTIATSYEVSIEPGTLYQRIKEVADDFGLGFRILNTVGGSKKFQIYEGVDRSGAGGVAFSEELDNLSSTSLYTSSHGHKNVAYVVGANGYVIVDRLGNLNPTISGLDRSVLYVDATDIDDPAGTTLTNLLKARGKQELAYYKKISLFDGQIDPDGIFKYKIDYDLGDLVAFKGDDNVKQSMMVTEYIYTYDSNGYRAYPTLSA